MVMAGQLGGEVHSLLIGDSGLAGDLAACGGAKVINAVGCATNARPRAGAT